MPAEKKFKEIISSLPAPARLDAYLARVLKEDFSRSEIKEAILAGDILLNGSKAAPKTLVQTGDEIEGTVISQKTTELIPEDRPVKVIFEDDSIMVIDKPAGLVVHPGAGRQKGTLVHALLGRGQKLSDMGDPLRPGIVHRIDKDTSGLLLVAKNNKAHRALAAQFESHGLQKSYLALVDGRVEYEEGEVSKPIGRHPHMREKMSCQNPKHPREAQTHYRVIKRFKHHTLLEVSILTGRTHQIRVHMASIGNPVSGDHVYGKKGAFPRQMLHAAKIGFSHPKSGKILTFKSDPPEDFKSAIEGLESL